MGSHHRNYFIKNHSREEAKGVIEDVLEEIREEHGPKVYIGPHAVSEKFPKKADNQYISPSIVKEVMGDMFDEGRLDRAFSLKEHYRQDATLMPLYRLSRKDIPEGIVSVKIGDKEYSGELTEGKN